MHRILLIEDDPALASNLVEFLGRDHGVELASDGVNGLRMALLGACDLVVLDLALPRLDGLELCRQLRLQHPVDPPVLMLTARDTLEDKLQGFEAGADDYLVKPFALRELAARVAALLRRRQASPGVADAAVAPLRVADLELDLATWTVRRGGDEIRVHKIAMRLLETLMRASPKVVTRQDLEQQVWDGQVVSESVIRTHVWGLRRALDPDGGRAPLIHTVHGVGYRLTDESAAVDPA